jgi:hypothetical protein
MEKGVIKRPLVSEGILPLIADPTEALEVFAEILKRGATFYPDGGEASGEFPKVCRVVALVDS